MERMRQDMPGMNKGELHSKNEIKEKCKAYTKNTPIDQRDWQKIAQEIANESAIEKEQ